MSILTATDGLLEHNQQSLSQETGAALRLTTGDTLLAPSVRTADQSQQLARATPEMDMWCSDSLGREAPHSVICSTS
jgi:hypothetical protein